MRTDKLQKQSWCHCPGCQPTDSRFRFQARQCWILDGQRSSGTGFSHRVLRSPCQYYSTTAL